MRAASLTYINITETIDLKIKALKQHRSQVGSWDLEPRIKAWASEAGQGKEMDYAETFKVITLVSDEDFGKMNQD